MFKFVVNAPASRDIKVQGYPLFISLNLIVDISKTIKKAPKKSPGLLVKHCILYSIQPRSFTKKEVKAKTKAEILFVLFHVFYNKKALKNLQGSIS